jgi:hypothetical protein
MYACKGWARIHPVLVLLPARSIVLRYMYDTEEKKSRELHIDGKSIPECRSCFKACL